jgi:hypothetical protein
VGPHAIVHRRDQKYLGLSGEQAGRQQIIREAVGSATHEIGGGRSNYYDFRFASEPDVIESVSGPKDLGVDRAPGNRFECDGADELARGASHHYIDLSSSLCKQTRQPH